MSDFANLTDRELSEQRDRLAGEFAFYEGKITSRSLRIHAQLREVDQIMGERWEHAARAKSDPYDEAWGHDRDYPYDEGI